MNLTYIIIGVILLIWIPWLWRYHIRPYFARDEINQKLLSHPDRKRLKKTERLLIKLYEGINTTKVSRRDRKQLSFDDDSFIYGEIDYLTFFDIAERVKPQSGEVFYDLGSGAGKAVFTAALYFDFSKACGIELLPGLHKLANAQIKKAQTIIQSQDKYFIETYRHRVASIQFINANILESDFSDADIVFINATCFHYVMWERLVEKLTQLKPGTRIIVTTKKIHHDKFKMVYEGRELMSWGMNSVNIYEKQI